MNATRLSWPFISVSLLTVGIAAAQDAGVADMQDEQQLEHRQQ